MIKTILRNLATAYGVYIASWWIAYPLDLAYGKLTHAIGIHYYGEVGGKVLLPLLLTIPYACLLYTSPSPRDLSTSRMPSSA